MPARADHARKAPAFLLLLLPPPFLPFSVVPPFFSAFFPFHPAEGKRRKVYARPCSRVCVVLATIKLRFFDTPRTRRLSIFARSSWLRWLRFEPNGLRADCLGFCSMSCSRSSLLLLKGASSMKSRRSIDRSRNPSPISFQEL